MAEIVMPRLSDTMEEGTILRWLKRDGEQVHRGEELVEIETDKATMIYESDQEGILQTVASEGDTLAVGEVIARLGDDGPAAAGAGTDQQATAPTVAAETGPPRPAAVDTSAGSAPTTPTPEGERVKASPLARRIAHDSGVDLYTVAGSGPGGRIVKSDVEAARGQHAQTAVPAPATSTAGLMDGAGGGSWYSVLVTSVAMLSASNGSRPVSSAYATTASAYWSVRPSTAPPWICSGAE